jgi:uncharacterized membrane protein YgcG
MRRPFVVLTALTASMTGPFSFAAHAAIGSGGAAVAQAWNRATQIEKAQYYSFDGVDYCWYDDGWQGPGWYWCGYDWETGYGWGGPYGWNGWAGGFYWRHRHHDHDGDHDRGHGVWHDERPREPERRQPPHGQAPLEGVHNHEGHLEQRYRQAPLEGVHNNEGHLDQPSNLGSNPIRNVNPSENRANPYSQHSGPDVSSGPIGGHPAGAYVGPGPIGGNGRVYGGAGGGLSGAGGGGFRGGGASFGGGGFGGAGAFSGGHGGHR